MRCTWVLTLGVSIDEETLGIWLIALDDVPFVLMSCYYDQILTQYILRVLVEHHMSTPNMRDSHRWHPRIHPWISPLISP